MEQFYIEPLRQRAILDEKEIASVFSNLSLILAVHRELLGDIGARFYSSISEIPPLGDIFTHLAPYLKVRQENANQSCDSGSAVWLSIVFTAFRRQLYLTYFREYDGANAALKRMLRERKSLASFCATVKADPRELGGRRGGFIAHVIFIYFLFLFLFCLQARVRLISFRT